MPIRKIQLRAGLSRNTIRKYLRSGAVEPKFKVPARPSKLDPFAEKLTGWLRARYGRKARIKIGDLEAEARTIRDIEELLRLAAKYRGNQPEDEK